MIEGQIRMFLPNCDFTSFITNGKKSNFITALPLGMWGTPSEVYSWTTHLAQLNYNWLHFPLTLSTIPLNFSSDEEQEACEIPKSWRHIQGVPQGIHHVIMSQVSLLCYVCMTATWWRGGCVWKSSGQWSWMYTLHLSGAPPIRS